ncbi:MAG: 4Fe-4S cluster-binding domain-containing protein [Deltaproteobacteria bacterium]|nr:4Fe-4S cluster-binding domain-containing protein [Deltaproteobacteria bacterium]
MSGTKKAVDGSPQVTALPRRDLPAVPPKTKAKGRVELPVIQVNEAHTEQLQLCGSHRPAPFAKANEGERQSLHELRAFVGQTEGKLTYNTGRLDVMGDGKVSFVDLTMEQVPLAMAMTMDPGQQARLAELRTDWPGGVDPLMRPASYVALVQNGEIDRRIKALKKIREADQSGAYKKAGLKNLKIGGYNLNVGEERAISGNQGSGTVYFSGCSMSCNFCQYNDISQLKGGANTKVKELSEIFLDLQDRGAHNIQLMTPSHFMVEILQAVKSAAEQGLKIPLVYNTGGFEDLNALKQLDGLVDIYLPDAKFGTNEAGKRYGRVDGYADNVKAAIAEMHRQVGPLEVDERGVAQRGLMVRHLVMPGEAAAPREVAAMLAEISKDLEIHLMHQWTPQHLSFQTPEVNRPTTDEEYEAQIAIFRAAGLKVADQSGGGGL